MKIITIIGARPQIIKAAALSRAISNHFADTISEIIVHTGQHYDQNMSEVFFDELGIPKPTINLNIGSGSHGKQTALMIEKIEEILIEEQPNALVVYGDTNSTLAATIAASKIHVPIVHIEAGLRSFNKKMPEEINRIMCDHASSLLFSPTKAGYQNLLAEGFKASSSLPYTADNPGIFHCGDVMYDNSLYFSELSAKESTIIDDLGLTKGAFILATVHRNDNTDNKAHLTAIFEAFESIATQHNQTIVLPLHPRTKKMLHQLFSEAFVTSLLSNKNIQIIEPVSFLDMIALEMHSKMIITDSGGVQKEAFFFKKPCIILRPETEWIELVECGAAKIVGADKKLILESFDYFEKANNLSFPELFGDGKAAKFIGEQLLTSL
ncbi:MAG: UDP-N-acetylglucosamine 2-epimerase (non-hydrolyzing) [Flavobacteriales bacterium]|jgi:UDP-GlcNAc3NAcA epimerase|nr:UDP-N-acetylglucosamine 2-epimerase (non-hydrolyzing) [Flavobacteriales bacterium]